MSIWNRIMRGVRKGNVRKGHFAWKDVTLADLDTLPDALEQISKREFDGMIIRGILSPDELSLIAHAWETVGADEMNCEVEGMRQFPSAFAMVRGANTLETHLEKCKNFVNDFPDRFGVDFLGRIDSVLGKIGRGLSLENIPGNEQGGRFAPFNFRELLPGKGNLTAHCGNFFHEEFAEVYRVMAPWSNVKDQLSYFMMLQQPESGRELVVYDLDWETAEVRLPGATKIKGKDGTVYDIDNPKQLKRISLNPEPGDLILFAGGTIWHRVTMVEGSRSRITMG